MFAIAPVLVIVVLNASELPLNVVFPPNVDCKVPPTLLIVAVPPSALSSKIVLPSVAKALPTGETAAP